MSLKGKVALVTGASRGIGQAIAIQLGLQQAIVIGTATSDAGAENISAALKAQGIEGCGLTLDVASNESIEHCLQTIKTQYGMPAILINNAAITEDNLLLRMKEEEWDKVLQTNLTSVFKMSKACLRDMVKARWGRIISIGSVVGSTGNPGQANYAATKSGLLRFTKALAQEVGSRNITVNAIAPGFIDTDMTKSLNDDQRKFLLDKIPLQRLGKPEDIAASVLFLCSEGGSYITGQTMHVNGGMYLN